MTRFHTVDIAPLPVRTEMRLLAELGLAVMLTSMVLPFGPFDWRLSTAQAGVGAFVLLLHYRRRLVPFPKGNVFRGQIESKLGAIALQVVDGELRACPFVVRLDDGRIALVDDAALVLETTDESVELGVGSSVELTGNPTLTPYAPEGYRGTSAFRFRGEHGAPIGIRARAT